MSYILSQLFLVSSLSYTRLDVMIKTVYIQRLSRDLNTCPQTPFPSIPITAILQTPSHATTLFGTLALGIKHHGTITANVVLGPSDVGTPVVNLVQSVVLRISLLDLASGGTQEDQVDTIAATMVSSLGNLKVTLPVNGKGVTAIGDGTLDESTGIVGLFNISRDKLFEVLVDGWIVVVLESIC